jgi:hypothetical protein
MAGAKPLILTCIIGIAVLLACCQPAQASASVVPAAHGHYYKGYDESYPRRFYISKPVIEYDDNQQVLKVIATEVPEVSQSQQPEHPESYPDPYEANHPSMGTWDSFKVSGLALVSVHCWSGYLNRRRYGQTVHLALQPEC